MVTKLKAKFILFDYELDFFKRVKNLKQKDLSVKDYTEEFYKLTIWSQHREISKEKVTCYIHGLGFNIQDEIGMPNIAFVDDAYQYSLASKDKLKRWKQGSSQGKEKHDNLAEDKLSVEGEEKIVEKKEENR